MPTLTSLSTLGEGDRGPGLLATLLEESPFLRYLELQSAFEEDATDFQYYIDDATGSLQRRNIDSDTNSSYTSSRQSPNGLTAGVLAAIGDKVHVDRSRLADNDRGLKHFDKWLEKRMKRKAMAYAKALEAEYFNATGAGDPHQMHGLKVLFNGTTDVPGFTSYKGTLSAAAPSGGALTLDLTDAANYEKFYEMMEAAFFQVKNPTAILCNRVAAAKISSVARKHRTDGETKDTVGFAYRTWNGLPIIPLLDGAILNTEPNEDASATNSTSIWIMGPAEQRFSVVTNSGLFYHENLDRDSADKSLGVEWEIRQEWKVEERDAALRIMHVKVN